MSTTYFQMLQPKNKEKRRKGGKEKGREGGEDKGIFREKETSSNKANVTNY